MLYIVGNIVKQLFSGAYRNASALFHTATEYHLGVLKAKLAKYRTQLLEPQGKKGEKGEGFDVMKSGDARVALIGFPSVGKVCLRECFLY